MSGHIGRIGGRQVVAVLALGGGLLLGPLLPAQAETGPAGPGDGGPVPTTLDTVHDLASPVLVPPTGRPGGPTVGHWPGKR
ncbi:MULTISPECIES: hypothetical protein [unclassified Streptomyces]|uniref:hypothetical protein n=1 Tax=unclassified Streptomyces TaxID=2593676 RepID=UPI0003742117|nr:MULTISPECIES: hypothetical protein [unclassified Streptomyces]